MRIPKIVSVGCFLALAAHTAAQTITPVGVGPIGPTFFAGSISADGSTFLGKKSDTPGGTPYPVRWTVSLGMQDLRPLLGGVTPRIEGVDGSGSILVGFDAFSGNLHATRWTAFGGNEDLGAGPGASATSSSASRVSADSQVIFGGWTGAGQSGGLFRWTRDQGMQDIGRVFGASQYSIEGVSGDGAAMAGYAVVNGNNVGFKWTQSTGFVALAPLSVGMPSAAMGISQDASFIVGYSYLTQNRATRWGSNGVPQNLGVLAGGIDSYAYATNSDGSVVCGVSDAALLGDRAFLWTQALGMVDLNTYLPTIGVNLTGWTLSECRGISADGHTLVGSGRYVNQQVGWIVSGLPPASGGACCTGTSCTVLVAGQCAGSFGGVGSACGTIGNPVGCCPANFNRTGGLSVQDIFDFLGAWFAGDIRADFNASQALTVQDIFDFLGAWFAGCAG